MKKKRVLFVCIGNSCRSQMAEWFAKSYGADVMDPASAGMAPAAIVAEETKQTMLEKGIRMVDPFPKGIVEFDPAAVDLIVNISGSGMPRAYRGIETVVWPVEDPIGKKEAVYIKVRDQLETLVMRLILDLRRGRKPA